MEVIIVLINFVRHVDVMLLVLLEVTEVPYGGVKPPSDQPVE